MTSQDNSQLKPIHEDDLFIERALEDANIPTLMMAIIHLTGDSSLLDGKIKPQVTESLDPQGGLSEEEKAEVRALALKALIDYRDRGCPAPEKLPEDVIRRMGDFIVGAQVPEEYLPMMYEEMSLDENYTRASPWQKDVPEERKQAFKTIVIGAGMSGILTAIKMDEIGLSYTIIEKNEDVGGTWLENTYPGCRVDVPNHFFSFSFERNPEWSHHYSVREDLFKYFSSIANKYKIRDNIQFGSEVEEARWSAEESKWHVRVRRRDGSISELVADVVITAVGQLNRPKLPEIPGRDSFKGATTHTSGFDRSIDFKDKRVAVIGTGASALQMVPELARQAGKLHLFQRTPTWVLPTPTYHETVPEGMKWLLAHAPFYAGWYRFLLFWGLTDGHWDWFEIDPSWPHQDRSVSAVNEEHRINLTKFIKEQIADRTDLLDKVIPQYPPFAKRMLLDNGNYLRTLTRDNVDVISTGIASIDETGVLDVEGNHYDVDIIVFATGFNSNKFLFPMRVVGEDGLVLNEYWQDDSRAYLGLTVPHFPNLFMVWGPGTSVGAGGSMIFVSECNVRYITSAMQQMIEQDIASIECRSEIYSDYASRTEQQLEKLVWSSPGVSSWYKNAKGKVVSTLPWRLVDYWNWTKSANLADFNIKKKSDKSSREAA